MVRVFSEVKNNSVNLNHDDKHYLRSVLRLRIGHEVLVSDPISKRVYQAIVTDGACNLKILKEKTLVEWSTPVESIAMALTKGSHNDEVCEKATELGIRRIFFWEAEQGNVKLKENSKLERYQKVALAAAKQSGKNYLPEIKLLGSLKEAILAIGHRNIVVASLLESAKPCSELNVLENCSVLIGPEGDFSPKENDLVKESHFTLMSLGPYTLRSETAALSAIVSLQTKIGFRNV